MPRPLLLLLTAALLASNTLGCSSIVHRAGQPSVIGDLHRGTPKFVAISNSEGQTFRIPRASITGTRLSGMRMLGWSLLSGSAFMILGPVSLLRWYSDASLFDAIDSDCAGCLDVTDEVEVIDDAEAKR